MNKNNNLLIVEDDLAFSLVLTNNFSDRFNLRVANTSHDAMKLLNDFVPDVILLDYFLPDQNGGELFESIKAQYPDVEIIILSANDSSKIVVDLVKKGVRNYVVKDENAINELNEIFEEMLS